MSESLVQQAEVALAEVAAAWDRLAAIELDGIEADDGARLTALLERQVRRGRAAQVRLLDELDRSGAHLADGHSSAKVMMRHHGHLSNPEAAQRDRSMRMLRELPEMAAVHAEGLVGTDHVRRLARVWSNPRVRPHLPVCEAEFVGAARELEYPDFDLLCREWENRVDQEGAAPSHRRWTRRDFTLVQDHNGFWDVRGRLMSADGADAHEAVRRVADAERLADVEWAKAEHGDEWRQYLPRTSAQLRHDAFMILLRRGAAAEPGAGNGGGGTVDFLIDDDTFQAGLRALVGADPLPVDALTELDRNRFSHTGDGVYVRPEEIAARALAGHVRRVVFDSAGVVIDLGRRSRLFTGSARDAALLQATSCYWEGCWVPASSCEVDHLRPWHRDGRTNPGNGAPGCGHHNRIKEKGFHAWRDPTGAWRITRPDGSAVPDHLAHWPEPHDSDGDPDRAPDPGPDGEPDEGEDLDEAA